MGFQNTSCPAEKRITFCLISRKKTNWGKIATFSCLYSIDVKLKPNKVSFSVAAFHQFWNEVNKYQYFVSWWPSHEVLIGLIFKCFEITFTSLKPIPCILLRLIATSSKPVWIVLLKVLCHPHQTHIQILFRQFEIEMA